MQKHYEIIHNIELNQEDIDIKSLQSQRKNNRLACDECNSDFKNKDGLQKHKRKFHNGGKQNRLYPCYICDKTFTGKQISEIKAM